MGASVPFASLPCVPVKYLVIDSFGRQVCRLIMSAAKILSEKLICGREAKLPRQMGNFEDNLSVVEGETLTA